MPYRDARCVYVANNLSEAETTVAFLASHDVEAKVIDGSSAGLLDGIAGLAGSSSRGVEVWADISQHPEVAQLLEEHAAMMAEKVKQGEEHGPTEVTCEKCGRKTTFPGDLYGTIQDCPKCGSYLDVGPGEELDWEAEAEEGEVNAEMESESDADTVPDEK